LKVPYTVAADPFSLLAKYRRELKGVVVYDPLVPDSINVATTMAGLMSGVVVSPSLAEVLEAAPYKLPIIADLRGRFSGRLDAYAWAFDNLWPRVTHRMLIGLPPEVDIPLPPGIPPIYTTLLEETRQIQDGSNFGAYTLDLSSFLGAEAVYLRFDDSFPDDGWGPSVGRITVSANGQVIADFFTATDAELPFLYDADGSLIDVDHRFMDGTSYGVYRFQPPPGTTTLSVTIAMWNEFKVSATNATPALAGHAVFPMFRDYAVANGAMVFWLDPTDADETALFERILDRVQPNTPYLGWFPSAEQGGEDAGVQLASEHSVYTLAADYFLNMSVFSGIRAPVVLRRMPPVPPLQNKIYVTFTMSDGDNLQYDQHRLRFLWDDRARGKVPINWSVSPLLLDGAPAILSRYQAQATANDVFVAGPSGAGYVFPGSFPDATFDLFTKLTGSYMSRTGLTSIYALNRQDANDVPLSTVEAASFAANVNPLGMWLNFGPPAESTVLEGAIPQSTGPFISSIEEGQQRLAEAADGWDGSSPRFVSICVIAWNMTPSDLAALARSLGPQYRVVRGDHYFKLLRQYLGLPQP
jgi:hypothetical protein